jgi:hypothetical protein
MQATWSMAIVFAALGVAGAAPPEDLPALNSKVLQFAKDHIGKQVGNGECWALAHDALEGAGARVPGSPGVGVKDFGRHLDRGEKALPGDVIQFDNVLLESPDGTTVTAAVHTGIVLQADKGKLLLLHQNWNGVRKVVKLDLSRFMLKKGKLQVFRPVPPEG